MGCCVSSTKAFNSPSTPQTQHHSLVSIPQVQPSRSGYSNAKPDPIKTLASPPMEEESVKEVLSENPTPKPEEKKTVTPCSEKDAINKAEEISEVSYTCSFTESTITEKVDDYEELRQKICRSPAKLPKNQSFSGDWGPKREKRVGNSPTRKPDQSPSRRTLKLVQQQNRSENSRRRSRSPANNRTVGVASGKVAGRSPSHRRSGMSPGREAKESLENPLVSLECFIFL